MIDCPIERMSLRVTACSSPQPYGACALLTISPGLPRHPRAPGLGAAPDDDIQGMLHGRLNHTRALRGALARCTVTSVRVHLNQLYNRKICYLGWDWGESTHLRACLLPTAAVGGQVWKRVAPHSEVEHHHVSSCNFLVRPEGAEDATALTAAATATSTALYTAEEARAGRERYRWFLGRGCAVAFVGGTGPHCLRRIDGAPGGLWQERDSSRHDM